MSSLPNGCALYHVWCGSEYTVGLGTDGLLWSRGWNEHGNLGNGQLQKGVVDTWERVIAGTTTGEDFGDTDRKQLHLNVSSVWEGSLGCGGSHCLCWNES